MPCGPLFLIYSFSISFYATNHRNGVLLGIILHHYPLHVCGMSRRREMGIFHFCLLSVRRSCYHLLASQQREPSPQPPNNKGDPREPLDATSNFGLQRLRPCDFLFQWEEDVLPLSSLRGCAATRRRFACIVKIVYIVQHFFWFSFFVQLKCEEGWVRKTIRASAFHKIDFTLCVFINVINWIFLSSAAFVGRFLFEL